MTRALFSNLASQYEVGDGPRVPMEESPPASMGEVPSRDGPRVSAIENWDEDRFSFEDSDRFEEDSLCSWSTEPESLCNNWRGWKKPPSQGNVCGPSAKRYTEDFEFKVPSLTELTAKCVASYIPFELVELVYPPVPEQLQLRIAFWSFPDNEEDIRLYSCLANGSADEFQKGEQLYKMRAVRNPLQIGFHLSATIVPTHFVTNTREHHNVAVTFDRRKITTCNCTCSLPAYWCSHVVAVCLYRINNPDEVCLRAPVSESLSRLKREQLQKFAQYLISELPQQILPTAQRLLDELLSGQPSAINSVCGAPDPTAGASISDTTTWFLVQKTLHENIKKILIKFCIPAPMVFSDVNCLSTTAPPAAAEWSSLLRPLRGREPEGMWNLLSIVVEMFKRNDMNATALLEIITQECLACDQIILWWYTTKAALHVNSGGGRHSGANSNAHASQHACSSLCDEIVALWRLAALSPRISPEESFLLEMKFNDWHYKIIERVAKIRGNHVTANHASVFPGFKPAIKACRIDWEDYPIPGVTYVKGVSPMFHHPFTCFMHECHINQVNSSHAVLHCHYPFGKHKKIMDFYPPRHSRDHNSTSVRNGYRSSISSEGFCENEGDADLPPHSQAISNEQDDADSQEGGGSDSGSSSGTSNQGSHQTGSDDRINLPTDGSKMRSFVMKERSQSSEDSDAGVFMLVDRDYDVKSNRWTEDGSPSTSQTCEGEEQDVEPDLDLELEQVQEEETEKVSEEEMEKGSEEEVEKTQEEEIDKLSEEEAEKIQEGESEKLSEEEAEKAQEEEIEKLSEEEMEKCQEELEKVFKGEIEKAQEEEIEKLSEEEAEKMPEGEETEKLWEEEEEKMQEKETYKLSEEEADKFSEEESEKLSEEESEKIQGEKTETLSEEEETEIVLKKEPEKVLEEESEKIQKEETEEVLEEDTMKPQEKETEKMSETELENGQEKEEMQAKEEQMKNEVKEKEQVQEQIKEQEQIQEQVKRKEQPQADAKREKQVEEQVKKKEQVQEIVKKKEPFPEEVKKKEKAPEAVKKKDHYHERKHKKKQKQRKVQKQVQVPEREEEKQPEPEHQQPQQQEQKEEEISSQHSNKTLVNNDLNSEYVGNKQGECESEGDSPRRASNDSVTSNSDSQQSGDEYHVYYFSKDSKKQDPPKQAESKKKKVLEEKEKSNDDATENFWDILFARAEGLHAHGHAREACKLAVRLAEELLANPPNLLIDIPPIQTKGKRRKINPATHQISCLASATLTKCAFLCSVLSEVPEYQHIAFKVGMFGLELARPPASIKPLEVKMVNQESDLVSIMKRIPLGPEEMKIIKEKAEQLKNGTLKTRGEALLPIMLASFVFDALEGSPSLRENKSEPKNPADEALAFEAAVAALGLKANVSEADHPLLCEGTRRQRGDLALTLLMHYKDEPLKLTRIMEKLLDREVHNLIKTPLCGWYYSTSIHPKIYSKRLAALGVGTGDDDGDSKHSPFRTGYDIVELASSRAHASTTTDLEQGLAAVSLNAGPAGPPQRGKDSSRYKGKRMYPSIPNQPSEAGAHFMFELAKTLLNKAGGNSSTSLFTQASTSQQHHGPHRALHFCAFQIGLYALGLHNCVSPNWLSRTYSSHVSWITGQAMEIGAHAVSFLIDTWEGHLTPPEAANIADRASRARDSNMVKAAAELALSCLPHAHALNPNEIHRAILQCKEQSESMLERSCLTVENAAKGGGVYPEVLFQVAKYWYDLYLRHTPRGEQPIETETSHDPMSLHLPIDPNSAVVSLIEPQEIQQHQPINPQMSANVSTNMAIIPQPPPQGSVVMTATPPSMVPVPYAVAPYSFTVHPIHSLPPNTPVSLYLSPPPQFQFSSSPPGPIPQQFFVQGSSQPTLRPIAYPITTMQQVIPNQNQLQVVQPQNLQGQNLQPQDLQQQAITSQALQPQALQPQTLQAQALQQQALQSQALQPQAIQAQALQQQALQQQALQPQTLQAQALQQQALQQQALQPQAMQAQALQQQALQPQALQMQALQAQTLQAQTLQVQALQQQALQQQALQPQTLQAQALQQQALQSQSLQPPTIQVQAIQQQALQPQGLQPQTIQVQAIQQQALQPQTIQVQTIQQQALQPQALQPQAIPAQALQQQALQPQPLPPQALQPQVIQPQNMQPQQLQVQGLQPQPIQPQPMQPQPMQPQSIQPQPIQPQPIQPQPLQSQPIQPQHQPPPHQSQPHQSRNIQSQDINVSSSVGHPQSGPPVPVTSSQQSLPSLPPSRSLPQPPVHRQNQHQYTPAQFRCLFAAYRVGMLALETLARRVHDDRPQAKYARNPPYGDDVKWLLQVSKKLGTQYLHQFCMYVVNSIVSPFILHEVAVEAAHYLGRNNPSLILQHLRTSLTPLVQKCQKMYLQCIHLRLYLLTSAEYEDFVNVICAARSAFLITPEGSQQFKEWLQFIKRSKSCKKELWTQINTALQTNNK